MPPWQGWLTEFHPYVRYDIIIKVKTQHKFALMESVDKHSTKCETTDSANYLWQNSDCGCVSEVEYG